MTMAKISLDSTRLHSLSNKLNFISLKLRRLEEKKLRNVAHFLSFSREKNRDIKIRHENNKHRVNIKSLSQNRLSKNLKISNL